MIEFFVAFFTGFLVKYLDVLESHIIFLLGVIFSAVFAYSFPNVAVAIIIASMITKKLDKKEFVIMALVSLASAAYSYMLDNSRFSLFYIGLLSFAALMDEVEEEYIGKIRPYLPLMGAILSLISNFRVFAAIVSFDVGYYLSTLFVSKYQR